MHIENPEALLKKPIIGSDGQMWIVTECNRYADVDRGPYYEFVFVTDVPVKSSPQQKYYHMTKALKVKAELTFLRHQHENIFELACNGEVRYGPISAIDTVDKFKIILIEMLPKCY